MKNHDEISKLLQKVKPLDIPVELESYIMKEAYKQKSIKRTRNILSITIVYSVLLFLSIALFFVVGTIVPDRGFWAEIKRVSFGALAVYSIYHAIIFFTDWTERRISSKS